MHLYRDLKQFAKYPFDVLIIGGGFVGANVARDAAMRGLRVGLIEAYDFGHNMAQGFVHDVHGNVRYLTKRHLGFVRETLRERMIWQQMAPHLVETVPFVLPLYDTDEKAFHNIRNSFRLFDLLPLHPPHVMAGPPFGAASAAGHNTGPATSHSTLYTDGLLRMVDGLRERHLVGGYSFDDVQFRHGPRTCLEVLLSAVEHGAQIQNYCRATEIVKSSTDVQGVVVHDDLTDEVATVKAKMVLNATGAHSDGLLRTFLGAPSKLNLSFCRSVQLLTRPITQGFSLAVPCEDAHDYIYIVPFKDYSLITTTTQMHDRPAVTDGVQTAGSTAMSRDDIDRVIASVNRNFPGALLAREDVFRAASGVHGFLPPLERDQGRKAAAETAAIGEDGAFHSSLDIPLHRQGVIFDHSKDGLRGLVTVLGDKRLNARAFADRVVSYAMQKLKKPKHPCRTAKQPLFGARMENFEAYLDIAIEQHRDLSADLIVHLVQTYGSQYKRVLSMLDHDTEPLRAGAPDIAAQVRYAVHHELAVTVEDVVMRRTALSDLSHPGEDTVRRIGEIMAFELGWTEAEAERYVERALAVLKAQFLDPQGSHMAA